VSKVNSTIFLHYYSIIFSPILHCRCFTFFSRLYLIFFFFFIRYTKLGQYIATLNHILPSVWTETLVTLQDSAASMSLVEDGLQLMIENELDAPLHELFSEFDKVPIAAASLAQVHRAVLKSNGDEVAVKVQYPHLGVQVVGDLWAMEVLSAVVGFFFPDFNLGWLLPEFEETADMELDFVQELKNNQRIAAMLAGRCDVYVPYAIEKYSSRKVLTMEFVRGLRVDDVHGIKMAELAPLDIANTITSVFGEMIYCHGFIHCDPHPGNLLIRRKTKARKDSWRWWKWWFGSSCEYELLLLDHGMYRRLEPAFRRAHCRLWKALLTQDIILGQACAKELNIDPIAVETISMMLTLRTPTSITRAGDRISSSEKSQLKKKYKNATAGDINRFIESLPRDLLFILRTNDIVRSLNKTLGGSTRARLLLMGDWSVRGLSIPFCTLSEDQFVGINLSLSQSSNRRRLNLQVDSEYSKNHIFPQISTFFKTTELWILRFKLWLLDAVFTMLRLKKERLANK